MNSKRTGIHLLSVSLLLLWGGIMLYFYTSKRIAHYLPPDGIFQPMVLWSSIGLIVLALFNLVTMKAKEAACCAEDSCEGHDHDHEHDHGHDHHHDHDHAHKEGHDHGHAHKEGRCGGHGHGHEHDHKHEHEHDHAHGHKGGCCGGHEHDHDHDHDHGHQHEHDHEHVHGPGCGHDHGHGHGHAHGHDHHHHDGCCGHDHPHEHIHEHQHAHAGHAHGILEESSTAWRLMAIFLLVVPITAAAVMSKDQYTSSAVENKGVYSQNFGKGAHADQFSLKRERAGDPGSSNTNAVTTAPAPAPTPATPTATQSTPPAAAPAPGTTPGPQDVMPKVNVAEVDKQASKGAEAKSYGAFTLADLEAQVPKNKETGNFMLEVTELFYTAGDKEVQSVLAGQPVETVGQVLPEKVNNEKGNRVRLFRMLVQCCAADARPYSIPVEFATTAPQFKDMTWVKVAGKMSFREEGGQTVPVLEATKIEETAAPENQMIY